MSNIHKLKLTSLSNLLERTFNLSAEDDLELELKEREAIIKIAKIEKKIPQAKTQSILNFMDSLPEPEPDQKPTDNASQVDHFLYNRDQHF